jgi:hypothetical protein
MRPLSILVIEPHSDDAFLSLGGHIESWIKLGHTVSILTVEAVAKRSIEAQLYAETVGAVYVKTLFLEELDLRETATDTPHDIFKAFEIFFDYYRRHYNVVIGPVGIQHPLHIMVGTQLRGVLGKYKSKTLQGASYLDTPYHIVQKNGSDVCEALHRHVVVSFLKPNFRKWKHISIFKSQSKFFFNNPPEKLRECVELIVSNMIMTRQDVGNILSQLTLIDEGDDNA